MNIKPETVSIRCIAENPLLVDIPELTFLGRMNISENGEYSVAFSDMCRTEAGSQGGSRDSGEGDVILLRNNCLLWSKKIPRPVDASVCNDGSVLVCDKGFGTDLQSTMLIIAPDGSVAARKAIKANLLSCAVGGGGQFSFFNSAGSDVDMDACKLFAYHTASGQLVFTSDFPITQIDKADLDGNAVIITAEDISYRYSLEGKLLNRVETELLFFERAMKSQWFAHAYSILNRLLQVELMGVERDAVFNAYVRLSESDAPPEWKAKCHRDMGEQLLLKDEKNLAVEQFIEALRLNAKIGIKRKLASLEAELRLR